MKLVITGALGHIGSGFLHRVPQVLPQAELILIDNLSTQRYCAMFHLPPGLRYRFVEGAIQDVDLDACLQGAAAVLHLGATTDAAGTASNPNLIFDNNLPSTERLIHFCIKHNVPLLFPSSTSVYGVQEGLVNEDCTNLKPQSPYADCKIQEEDMIKRYGAEGLRYCIGRFGTIFGVSTGMRFHTAVNKFCWQAAMGQPMTVWSTAMDQKRPYLGLSDACRFMAQAVTQDFFENNLYNVVSENFTVRNVVDTIREFVPDLSIKLVDHKIMNQLSYEVDNAHLRNKGFLFQDQLRTAVQETIELLVPPGIQKRISV